MSYFRTKCAGDKLFMSSLAHTLSTPLAGTIAGGLAAYRDPDNDKQTLSSKLLRGTGGAVVGGALGTIPGLPVHAGITALGLKGGTAGQVASNLIGHGANLGAIGAAYQYNRKKGQKSKKAGIISNTAGAIAGGVSDFLNPGLLLHKMSRVSQVPLAPVAGSIAGGVAAYREPGVEDPTISSMLLRGTGGAMLGGLAGAAVGVPTQLSIIGASNRGMWGRNHKVLGNLSSITGNALGHGLNAGVVGLALRHDASKYNNK